MLSKSRECGKNTPGGYHLYNSLVLLNNSIRIGVSLTGNTILYLLGV